MHGGDIATYILNCKMQFNRQVFNNVMIHIITGVQLALIKIHDSESRGQEKAQQRDQ